MTWNHVRFASTRRKRKFGCDTQCCDMEDRLQPGRCLPVLLLTRFAAVRVSYPKWPCGPSYKSAIPAEPSFAYSVTILSISGLRIMPWYPWGWPRLGLYSSGREWRIPKHLMGPIVRTFVSMMILSTGNIVFPIFNIGGAVASWLIFSLNLLWVRHASQLRLGHRTGREC